MYIILLVSSLYLVPLLVESQIRTATFGYLNNFAPPAGRFEIDGPTRPSTGFARHSQGSSSFQYSDVLPDGRFQIYGSTHPWNTFARHLQAQRSVGDRLAADIQTHAGDRPRGQCARAVRETIERTLGFPLQRTQHARNYGPSLEAAGFSVISNDTPLQPGDVRIIERTRGHPSGHMQMYTENGWMSDFRQQDEWPGSAYRRNMPSYMTYRYEGYEDYEDEED